jgi:hypothetical protein
LSTVLRAREKTEEIIIMPQKRKPKSKEPRDPQLYVLPCNCDNPDCRRVILAVENPERIVIDGNVTYGCWLPEEFATDFIKRVQLIARGFAANACQTGGLRTPRHVVPDRGDGVRSDSGHAGRAKLAVVPAG